MKKTLILNYVGIALRKLKTGAELTSEETTEMEKIRKDLGMSHQEIIVAGTDILLGSAWQH